MNIELTRVSIEHKEILRNLLEKYDYEFSQYDRRDVNKIGLYGYDYLDYYWTEEKRWAFFILVDDKLAGFVMVNDYPEVEAGTDYTLSEFFVMYKYRRLGIGEYAATKVFDMFNGKWQLKMHPHNRASVYFWNNIVRRYTKENYTLIKGHPEAAYDDGTLGDVILFDNRR